MPSASAAFASATSIKSATENAAVEGTYVAPAELATVAAADATALQNAAGTSPSSALATLCARAHAGEDAVSDAHTVPATEGLGNGTGSWPVARASASDAEGSLSAGTVALSTMLSASDQPDVARGNVADTAAPVAMPAEPDADAVSMPRHGGACE